MADVSRSLPSDHRVGSAGVPAQPARYGIPAWAFSFALHFAIFTTLGLTLKPTPRGAAAEATRDGGIVLVHRAAGKAQYFSEDDGSDAPAASAASANSSSDPFFPSEAPPNQTSGPQLPADPGPGPLAGGAPPGGGLPSADSMTKGSGKGGPLGIGSDFGVETQVFGVKGRGSRFVYVFDRSASMDGYEGRPLAGAKRELIASLESLQSVHQFQIIFYNEKPQVMNLFRGQPSQMVFADEQGKRQAQTFIGGIYADGGTSHVQALTLALRMRPDVIFFLTDADEPRMRSDELETIRRLNNGSVINAIEFGAGPSSGRHNFLQQLAEENDGAHAYVDVTRLPRGR